MRTLTIVVALVLLPSLAFGQAQTTGRVNGSVVDEEGNPIAGARITIVSSALQGERVVKSADNGQFLASLLPPGAYAITFSAPNKRPVQLSFRLGVGQTVPLDVTLETGQALVENVQVHSTAPELESTELGESFDYDTAVEQLPIQDRTLESVAAYAPNVSFGPTPDTLSIAGAPSFDTVVLLDGAEVSDPYFGSAPFVYLEDSIEEVQVLTSGISARYGRFQGGVVNAITKTGGNTFDGAVRVELDNQDWNSQTPFGEFQEDNVNETYQGSLGGYILKDKLWFFASARTVPTSEEAFTTQLTGESVTESEEDDRWQLKLRGAINPDHIVEISHLDRDRTIANRNIFDQAADALATDTRSDPQETNTLAYQGVLSPNLFLDFQATEKNVEILSGGTIDKGSPFRDLTAGETFHNGWFGGPGDPDVRDNETAGINLTQAVNSSWGTHTIEYGVQFVRSTTGGENRQSPTGFNWINFGDIDGMDFGEIDPVSGEVRFQIVNGEAFRFKALPFPGGDPTSELDNVAVYAQDTLELGKWRFDIGVRYDDYDGSGPLVQQTIGFDDIAPRLGLTYNLTQDWQLQATWGKYVSRVNDNFSNAETGVGSAPRQVDFYIGPDLSNQTYDQVEAVLQDDSQWVTFFLDSPEFGTTLVADDIEAPYANDFNVAIKRALPRNSGTFTLTYTNRDFNQLIDDFIGGFGITNTPNGPVDVTIWDNNPEAIREYQALTATWDWRPAANWGIGGNWTFSETKGNYEGEALNQPAVGSILGDFEGSRDDALAAPFGRLAGDIPHRAQLWGNYRFNFDGAGNLMLGAIAQYQSGFVWSRVAALPFADDPNSIGDAGNAFNAFFDGRGNNRFSGFWSLDVSGRYQFPVYRDFDGWLKLNVVNVLDNDELIAFSTAATTATNPAGLTVWQPGSSFGQARDEDDYQTPRTYLVTFGLTF